VGGEIEAREGEHDGDGMFRGVDGQEPSAAGQVVEREFQRTAFTALATSERDQEDGGRYNETDLFEGFLKCLEG
jgi:hypothetical protein